MRSLRSFCSFEPFALGSLVLVAACGGGPPPAAPTGPAKPPSAPVATTAPAAVDVSQVPEPPGLLVVGRVAKPEAILAVVGGWTHLPLPAGNELVKSVTDDAVGDVVDLAQPVDGAVTVTGGMKDPQVLAAFSVPVRSLDEARTRLEQKHRLVPGKNGSSWVSGIGKTAYDDGRPGSRDSEPEDEDEEEGCALAPAFGGARLVCGERAAVDALTPYLTRTLPRRSFTSDVHVELHPAAVRQQAQQLRALVPLLARGALGANSPALHALVEAGTGELVDLLGDTDLMSIDAQLADSGADATFRVDYQKTTSLLAKIGTSHPERADAPPPAFLHLPGDTDVALYTRGTDPKLFDHMKELLGNVALEAAGDAKMPEPERKALRDLVVDKMLTLLTGPLVYGKGFDGAAVDKAVANRRAVKSGDWAAEAQAERALGEQVIGWHLIHVEDPIAKVGPVLKDWSALWNRPAFAKWAKAHASSSKSLASMKITPVSALGVALPKDSVHLEISFPQHDITMAVKVPNAPGAKAPAPKKIAQKPIVFHVLAVPDQGGSWIGFGLDAKLVAQRAAQALSSAPGTGTLGTTAMADALKGTKANAGWVVTLRGLLVFTAFSRSSRSPYAALAMLPNHGTTPIVFTGTAQPPSQGAPAGSSVARFDLPRGAIEDAVRVVFATH
jgi:hypothetical protein